MKDNDLDMTAEVEKEKETRPKKKFFERRSSWFFLGFLLVLLIVLAGVLLGIPRGINDRVSLAETQASPKIRSQIESARLDIEEERYQLALDRLDWILDEMALYMSDEELAEVGELYSQTLLQLSSKGTATPVPSPTATVPV